MMILKLWVSAETVVTLHLTFINFPDGFIPKQDTTEHLVFA